MALDKEKKSNRLLASKRYTHDSFTDAQEAFTSTLDIQASEVYVQANSIPTSSLPFSGSTQHQSVYSVGGDNIIKYHYRHKLTKSNLNNEVWFFLDSYGGDSGIGAQVITGSQQTNFISPKYAIPELSNTQAEHGSAPGYLVKLFKSTQSDRNNVSNSDVVSGNDFTFDYKTGVVQFSSNTPSDSQYVYMTVYQYVGKTLANGLMNQSSDFISGSSTSTGSFGHLNVSGDAVIGGNLTLNIVSSSLLPDASAEHNIGSSSKRWNSGSFGYLDASGDIVFAGKISGSSTTATSSFHKLSVGTDQAAAKFHVERDYGGGNVVSLKIAKDNNSNELLNTHRADQHIFSLANGTQGFKIHRDLTDATSYAVGIGTVVAREKLDIRGKAGGDHAIQIQSGNNNPALKMGTSGSGGSGSAYLILDPVMELGTDIGGHSSDDNAARTGSLEIIKNVSQSIFDTHTYGDFVFKGSQNNQNDDIVIFHHPDKPDKGRAVEAKGEVLTGGRVFVNYTPATQNGSQNTSILGPGYATIGGAKISGKTSDHFVFYGNTILKKKLGSKGNLVVEGNVNVSGSISAEQFIVKSTVSTITSSFSSGSTIFGDSQTDAHRFTGSLFTTGSIISNGLGVISSSAQIADAISGSFTSTSQSIATSRTVHSQSITARISNVEGGSVGGGSISGNNSGDIALIGTLDYLSLSGQQLTLNQIDLTTDVSGSLPVTHLQNANVRSFVSGAFTGTSASFASKITSNSASFASRITSDSQSFASRINSVTGDAIVGVHAGSGLSGGGTSGGVTMSIDFSDTALQTGISGSFTAASSSFSTRTTVLEGNPVFSATGISGSFTTLSSSLSSRLSDGLGTKASVANVLSSGSGIANLLFVSTSMTPEGTRASGSFIQPSSAVPIPQYNLATSTLNNIKNINTTSSLAKAAVVKNDGDEDEYPLLMYSASYNSTPGQLSNGEFIQPYADIKHKTPRFTIQQQILYAKQISGSFIGKLGTDIVNGITGSWTPRVTVLETTSSLVAGNGAQAVGSKNSPIFAGLRVTGDIHAERYIVSSSVSVITSSFSSGSTIFGDTIDDSHRFTGSLSISGSMISNGLPVLSSSAQIADDITGSFFAPSQSIDSRITSLSSSLSDRVSITNEDGIVFGNSAKKMRNNSHVKLIDFGASENVRLAIDGPSVSTALYLYASGSNKFIGGGSVNATPKAAGVHYNTIVGAGTVDNGSYNVILSTPTYSPRIDGSYNTAIGNNAFRYRPIIQSSVAIGASAGEHHLSGSRNTIIGNQAAFFLDSGARIETSDGSFPYFEVNQSTRAVPGGESIFYYRDRASDNIIIGYEAGKYVDPTRDNTRTNPGGVGVGQAFRSGSNNIIIGNYAKASPQNPQFETVIGTQTIGHGSYTSTIGSGSLYVSTHGDGDVYAGTFTGSALLVSGNVSGSQTGSFGRLEVKTGKVNGDFAITDDLVVTDDTQIGGVLSATGNTIFGNAGTDTHTFTGHITASGDISASGTIFASKFESAGASNEVISFNDNLNITGHITSSGNIKISQNVIANGNISGSSTSTGSFGRVSTSTLDLDSIKGNWTNAGNTVADLGNITTVDINGGTIDGTTIATSDITVGADKTLDVSAGTLTLADDQISGDKVEGGTIASTTITTLANTTLTSTTIKDFTTVSGSSTSTGSFGRIETAGGVVIDNGNVSGTSTSTGSFGAINISGMSVSNVVDVSSSLASRINSIETSTISGVTSSLGIKGGANFGPATFSIDFSNTEFQTGISGSLGPNANLIRSLTAAGITGSWSPRVTVLEGSGYAQGVGTGNSPEFENLTLRGTLRAKEFIVSSSVTHMTRSFSSGSSVFGDSHDDTHQFTGSIISSGSITAPTFTGIFSGALSSSAQIADDISGSLGTNANLIRSLTASGISGSLGPNANLIRSLTASGITGSFTETSHSLQSRLTAVEINLDDDMTFAGDSGGDLVIDFDSETFTIAGGTNATTVGSGNTLTVNVDDAFLINSGDDTTSGKITAGGFITAGHVTASGAVTASSVNTHNISSVSGDLTLDSAGNITIDADGAVIKLKDNGTEFGRLSRVSSDFVIKSSTSDKDIVFKGNDNGSTITALTLDMSEGGNAILGGNISGSVSSTGSFGRVEIADNATFGSDISAGKLTVDNLELDGNSITVGSGDLAFNIAGLDIDFNSSNLIDGGDIISTKANAQISGSGTSTGSFGRLEMGGNLVPKVHNVSELGSPTNRWANIYSADLQLSNEDNEVGNEIDGTKGSWTIQEGEDDLYLLNRKNGKKYRFKLEEIT